MQTDRGWRLEREATPWRLPGPKLGSKTTPVFSTAHATADRYDLLALDFAFPAGATPVYQFASSKNFGLIQVLFPLNAALLQAGAVTLPPQRESMPGSKGKPRQCKHDKWPNNIGDDCFYIDCQW